MMIGQWMYITFFYLLLLSSLLDTLVDRYLFEKK